MANLESSEGLNRVWSAVICLPHIKSQADTRSERIQCLTDLIPKVIGQIDSRSEEKVTGKTSCLSFTFKL